MQTKLAAAHLLAACAVLAVFPGLQPAWASSIVTHSTFNEAIDWASPNQDPYQPGIYSTHTAQAPAAYEESALSPNAVAAIDVSRGQAIIMSANANLLSASWTQEIAFHAYSFTINGARYTVPKSQQTRHLVLLPLQTGIAWAPLCSTTMAASIKTALKGSTPIFYTPYHRHGGSLAQGAQQIGALPHSWFGPDGPMAESAWSGWLPRGDIADAHISPVITHQLTFTPKGRVLSDKPHMGAIAAWPTVATHAAPHAKYYAAPHYASSIASLTRTRGGMILTVGLRRAVNRGENAGTITATYYWSETTHKWTPLNQDYMVQTLGGLTDVGSDAVYWLLTLPVANGTDQIETYFNPATLSIRSIWLMADIGRATFADGSSWLIGPNPGQATDGGAFHWTIYTP